MLEGRRSVDDDDDDGSDAGFWVLGLLRCLLFPPKSFFLVYSVESLLLHL